MSKKFFGWLWVVTLFLSMATSFGAMITLANGHFAVAIVFLVLFILCLLYTVIYYFVDQRKEKKAREYELKNKANSPKTNFGNASGFSNSYCNNYKKKPQPDTSAQHGGIYGWDEEGDTPEYALIQRFDEYIREKFPFVPLKPYKVPKSIFDKINKDIVEFHLLEEEHVRELALSMQKHLGYKENKVVVTIKDANPGERIAGTHERLMISFSSITIYFSTVYNAYNVVQIMAHEMSHAFQQYYGHPCFNDNELESEKFTDALALYLGFTDAYKNGQKYKVGNTIHRLGYLNDNSLKEVDEIQTTRFIKEKPIKEYKDKFAAMEERGKKTLVGITIFLEQLKNSLDLVSNETIAANKELNSTKHKYVDSDYLRGCEFLIFNLIQYTEEEAIRRLNLLDKNLAELANDKTLVEFFIWNK